MSGSLTPPPAIPESWIDQTINGMQYKVLLPVNYDPSVKYPALLYLHALDMGLYPDSLVSQADGWFNTAAFRAYHSDIVVMPILDQSADQSGQTINWGGVSTADTAGETNAIAALKQVMAHYSADPTRIYVTGNSMGGIGTEDMLIKFNAYTGNEGKLFAAGLALAGADYGQGYPQPSRSVVTALKNVPFWAIHGGQDTQVPLAFDQNLYAAERAISGVMKYTQDNSLGHDVWDTYYPQTGTSSPLNWLFSQSTGAAGPAPNPAPSVVPSANNTEVMAGSTAAITDAAGNKWTVVNGAVQENGAPAGYSANVAEIAYVSGAVWQENTSKLWWKWDGTAWSGAGTATSPLPASGSGSTSGSGSSGNGSGSTSGGSASGSGTGTTPGTRDPSQIPFASDSVFNLPLGSGAQWTYNAQLAGSNVFINTAGNYNENIWKGTASDPLVTVTSSAAAGGTPGTFQVHIPLGAVPAGGGDQTFSVDDTVTHTWYSFGGFSWTGATTATASQGSGESDYGSGIQVDGSNWDQGVGTLRQTDLQAGAINHMLRIELPTSMLKSYSSSAYQLAPSAWPQTQEDGFGPSSYSGTVPFGVTIGIPMNATEPAAVKANAGANMLWHALHDHGAMIRDSGGSGNTVIFQADQEVNPNDPLIQGMIQYGAQIMAQTEILANQGPNSINGGGTPVVALDPNPSDMPTGSTSDGGAGSNDTSGSGGSMGSTTVLTPTSGGSITDASGNIWTLTASGSIDENGNPVAGGGGSMGLAYVNQTIYGEDAASKQWYAYNNGSWTGPYASLPASTSATSTITVRVSEDAYQGDAKFTVGVDGTQVGGTLTASALHGAGDANVFVLTGNWGAGTHDVKLSFINDASGGTAATNRNLYVNSVAFNGTTYSGTTASLLTNGSKDLMVGGSVSAGTAPADTLTLHLSEDAYNGNAQFVLTIDGKTITTAQDVTALHSGGAWQDLTFAGNFGAGTHTVGVKFTNDAYGGSASTDRNLYVNGIDCNGTHYGSGVTSMMSNATATFTITTNH